MAIAINSMPPVLQGRALRQKIISLYLSLALSPVVSQDFVRFGLIQSTGYPRNISRRECKTHHCWSAFKHPAHTEVKAETNMEAIILIQSTASNKYVQLRSFR